jgi:hypothetical protein
MTLKKLTDQNDHWFATVGHPFFENTVKENISFTLKFNTLFEDSLLQVGFFKTYDNKILKNTPTSGHTAIDMARKNLTKERITHDIIKFYKDAYALLVTETKPTIYFTLSFYIDDLTEDIVLNAFMDGTKNRFYTNASPENATQEVLKYFKQL